MGAQAAMQMAKLETEDGDSSVQSTETGKGQEADDAASVASAESTTSVASSRFSTRSRGSRRPRRFAKTWSAAGGEANETDDANLRTGNSDGASLGANTDDTD